MILQTSIHFISFRFTDSQSVDKSQKRSKRDVNGTIKHESNPDMFDNSTTGTNTPQKKSKISHVYKQEPTIVSTFNHIKTEPQTMSNFHSPNERPAAENMATVAPMIVQPKKEKPTAKYDPLLARFSSTNAIILFQCETSTANDID